MNYKNELNKIKDEIKAELIAAGYDEGDAEICAHAGAVSELADKVDPSIRMEMVNELMEKGKKYIIGLSKEEAETVGYMIADAYVHALVAVRR